MDVAALGMKVDTSDVLKASADLDKFAASSDKAAASAGKLSGGGNTAKLATDYARAARAADMASGSVARAAETVNRANAAMGAAATASNAMRVANDNTTRSFAMADAQVNAYRNHLQQLVAAQTAQTQAAGANAMANKAAGTEVAAVGVAGRATGAIMSGVAGIFGGVLGAAIGFVVSELIEVAAKFFDANKEAENLTKGLDAASFSSYALNDAQGILSSVFDLTTGKITTQTGALRDLARAQLLVAQAQSMGRAAEHNAYLTKVGQETGRTEKKWWEGGSVRDPKTGGYGMGWYAPTWEAKIAQGVQGGTLSAQDAMRTLAGMQASGNIKPETFSKMLGAVTGIGAEAENQKVFEEALKSLDTGKLGNRFVNASQASTRTPRAGPSSSRGAEMSEEARAIQERTRATDQYIATLGQEVAKIGLSEEAVRRYEVTQALSRATTDAQREAIAHLSAEREKGLKVLRQTQELEAAEKALATSRSTIASGVDIELQTMHLVGAEREREVLRIQRQIELTDLLAKVKKAEADGNVALAETYRQLAESKSEEYAKKVQVIDGTEQIAQQTKAITEAREVARGFFTDWINGVREGENVFKSFEKSVIKALNNVIDKIIQAAIEQLILNAIIAAAGGGGGGGGGLLSGLFADGGAFGTAEKFALGGAFDRAQRFANGGTFTNQIVNNPTLFKFANGGKIGLMGEEGPEAVMPLVRGANGKLGVHAQGGGGGGSRPVVRMGDINVTNSFAGAIGVDSIMAMQKQSSEMTRSQIRRELQSMLEQLERDGAIIE